MKHSHGLAPLESQQLLDRLQDGAGDDYDEVRPVRRFGARNH